MEGYIHYHFISIVDLIGVSRERRGGGYYRSMGQGRGARERLVNNSLRVCGKIAMTFLWFSEQSEIV